MIAARFGGDAALEDPVADFRCDADALVGDFNNQFLLVQLYQHVHRGMRERCTLGRFNGVIQQVPDDSR